MATETRRITVPEAILVEILARLPLRSIARSKPVSKTWKSVIESSYFRRRFVSLHKNSSSSWSLMLGIGFLLPITEAIGFHGCEKWDLPKSLGSYIFPFQPYPNLSTCDYSYVASSNGLVWIEVCVDRTENMSYSYKSFVGNPVSQQWFEIPPPPPDECSSSPNSLVTSVDENSVVTSFKVIRACQGGDGGAYVWRVYVYSSETGLWTLRRLLSSAPIAYWGSCPSMNLNGMLYLWEKHAFDTGPGYLIAHNFYAEEADDDQSWVVPFPSPYNNNRVKRCLTTSGGNVIFIEILNRRLRVWRLVNYKSKSSEWRLLWDINMATVGFNFNCFPMAMNPFDSDVVYLWSRNHGCLVSGNLKKQEFILHQESVKRGGTEDCCRINTSDSKGYMKAERYAGSVVMLSQFVLPQWMDSVPRLTN